MNILGIETSCDETAAAVVKDGRTILSNVVVSSLREHSKYGGIIPEIASRRQLACITAVVDEALRRAGSDEHRLQAIAVTGFPGLIGSLLVGKSFARAYAARLAKPLYEIDHIQAHLYANFLRESGDRTPAPKLPGIGLVVSGGHTSLYHVRDPRHFRLIGRTRDDAAGEAFDKVARVLELGYPGGPAIEKKAGEAKKSAIKFTCARMPDTLDFSFSGIKTAVLYHKREHAAGGEYPVAEVAHAFQDSVTENLADKALDACQKYRCRTLLVGGGVAANKSLRHKLIDRGRIGGINVHFPPMPLCLDNAAMIAGLAMHHQ